MTGATWPSAGGRLERRYRRLLLAYPGRYRRGHGTEMVTTLLEMAESGQTRPASSDAWHLLASGVRQRFRLPSGRPSAWVAAVLITLILGAFGAAAGSWAAERTFTDLPDDAGVAALVREAAGGGAEFHLDRFATPWSSTSVLGVVDQPGWTPEAGRDRLTAGGWRVTAIRDVPGAAYGSDTATGAAVRLPLRGSAFDATRGGLRLLVTGYVGPGHGTVSVTILPADTGALRPAVLAGGLLGLLIGWPLAAAGAYRRRSLPTARRRIAGALTALAVLASAPPALACYVNVLRVLHPTPGAVNTVHSALTAGPYWSYGTRWMLPELAVAGLALAVAAWAVTRRRVPPDAVVDEIPSVG